MQNTATLKTKQYALNTPVVTEETKQEIKNT